jgi:hypothetical protein
MPYRATWGSNRIGQETEGAGENMDKAFTVGFVGRHGCGKQQNSFRIK